MFSRFRHAASRFRSSTHQWRRNLTSLNTGQKRKVLSRVGALSVLGLGGVALCLTESEPAICAQFANLDIKMEKKYVVIAAPGMEEFAKELVASDSKRFTYFETQWKKFPDGTDNIYVGGFYPNDHIHDANVLFLASFHSNDTTLAQYHALTMLCESFVDSMTILLPFYPTGTMERVLKRGTVATANTMAKMFSHLPDVGRPARLIVYDLHTLQNQFYYSDNCLADLRSAFPLLIEAIEGGDVDCIAFPDDGAEKRFGKYFKQAFPDMELVVCGKHRDPKDPTVRNIVIKDGNPSGRNIIIVDDMVQSGGTLYNCALELQNGGASSVSAFCTHAVFPKHSWERFVKGGDRSIFKKFYVTNTNPTVTRELPKDDCFEVLNIIPLFVKHL